MDSPGHLCRSCAASGKNSGHYGKTGDKSYTWRGGELSMKCDNCGKVFSRARANIHTRNFCTLECFTEFKTGKGKGMYDHTDNTKKMQSDSRNLFISDPVNREKLSAALQGISYDEWEGFVMNAPYCPAFDEMCRESNREKYDRKCFLCRLPESENITSTGKPRKLAVHHVDMNKDQGCDNHEWKLVPLCLRHHGSAHTKLVMDRIIYLLNNVWNTVQ